MNKKRLPENRRPISVWSVLKNEGIFYVYLLPLCLLVILFGIYPIIKSITISFTDSYTALTLNPVNVGFDNYVKIFQDPYFRRSVWITLKFTLISVPINILIAFLLALALTSKKLKYGRTFFKLAVFIPNITSDLVVAIVWRWMFNADYGAVNAVLSALKLPAFAGVASADTVLLALGIVTLWKNVGFYTILFISNLQLIDPEYYEVAELDGCNYIKKVRYVTIPELRPAILLNSIYAIIQYLKVFTIAKVMTLGGPNYASNFLAYYAYDKFNSSQFGEATAMATVLFIIVIFFFGITFWLNRRFED